MNQAQAISLWARRLTLGLLAFGGLAVSAIQPAQAQVDACTELASMIRDIEADPTFRAHNSGNPQSRSMVGQNLTQQRAAFISDFNRFNCGAGGGQQRQQARPGDWLDRMFGPMPGQNAQPGFDYGQPAPAPTRQTRRTVCVRTCDGFFWPISFSTTDEHVNQDAIRCHEMCPGSDVLLFSYRNPGEQPEDMISLSGAPYRSAPYAFLYRERVDKSCSCRRPETEMVAFSGQPGQSEAVLPFETADVPLPRRDPRQAEASASAAATGEAVGEPTELNIVHFGDRPVRIVGPQTPYVPQAEEAS
ncbi:DUF2865 domain-containing protein [Pelagibacterium montanilacus]|uniref:DUF2865 domain-containing protein n=1 Tax=Pelagibacterium montanilacus TaxID=2185280 RepID=UPI0013E0E911|nr:DUF2865 domain-containing protein [Pelagibacterium montanilacus]